MYSESHISYLYSSIYYIEIIWILYFQLNSKLTVLIFLKKKKAAKLIQCFFFSIPNWNTLSSNFRFMANSLQIQHKHFLKLPYCSHAVLATVSCYTQNNSLLNMAKLTCHEAQSCIVKPRTQSCTISWKIQHFWTKKHNMQIRLGTIPPLHYS